jgi:hypothetical protein
LEYYSIHDFDFEIQNAKIQNTKIQNANICFYLVRQIWFEEEGRTNSKLGSYFHCSFETLMNDIVDSGLLFDGM